MKGPKAPSFFLSLKMVLLFCSQKTEETAFPASPFSRDPYSNPVLNLLISHIFSYENETSKLNLFIHSFVEIFYEKAFFLRRIPLL